MNKKIAGMIVVGLIVIVGGWVYYTTRPDIDSDTYTDTSIPPRNDATALEGQDIYVGRSCSAWYIG